MNLSKGFVCWLVGVFALILIGVVITTAWAVQHALRNGPHLSKAGANAVLAVAEFPGQVKLAMLEVAAFIVNEPRVLLIDGSARDFIRAEPALPVESDSGYLLLSHVSPIHKQSVVSLIRISDGKEIETWVPDFDLIATSLSKTKSFELPSKSRGRAIHPILFNDGEIVFNVGGALVRQSSCSSKPVWILEGAFHHSNELDQDGNIWTPSVFASPFPENAYLNDRLRDDAIAKASPTGKLIESRSFSRILIDNGLSSLLLGHFGDALNEDPIHLNDITPALTDAEYWKKGDLLLSARNLSTVFLYRPTTNKIIWHKTGPWMNQHDANFVDTHRISVFGNDVVVTFPAGNEFLNPTATNQVYIYDFSTRQVSSPFEDLLRQYRVKTVTEGRGTLLPDGGLFVEETGFGRNLRFLKQHLLWSRTDWYDNGRIGQLGWSRYLSAAEIKPYLRAISDGVCTNQTGKSRS